VVLSPLLRSVFVSKPNSFLARDVSKRRLGCPSGLDASQRISPVKPVRAANFSASSLILISNPAPMLTGSKHYNGHFHQKKWQKQENTIVII